MKSDLHYHYLSEKNEEWIKLQVLIISLIVFFWSIATQASESQDWLIKASSSGGRLTALSYVDANAITESSDAMHSAWIETYYSDREIERTGIRRARSLKEFDCANRRHRVLQFIINYSDPQKNQKNISVSKSWGSDDLIELEFFCGNRNTNQFMRLFISPEDNARRLFFLNFAGIIVTKEN